MEVFEPSVLSEAAERTKVLGIPLKAQDPDTSYDVNGDGKATAADYITGSIPVLSRFKQKHGQQLKVPFSQKLGELAGYLWPFAPGKHGGGGGAAAEAPGGIPRGHTRTGGSTRSGGST